MELVLQIVVGLIALSTLFFAYKSWNTWRVPDILLVVFIFFLAAGFVYITANALKANAEWRGKYNAYEKAVKDQKELNRVLVEGSENAEHERTPGITELQQQLHKLAIERGEVWLNVQPTKPKLKPGTQDVTLTLTVPTPDPHGMLDKAIIYIFAPGKDVNSPAVYVGKFKVVAAPPKSKSVEVSPATPLTEQEIKRLSSIPGPWNVHLMMPIDEPSVFASMTEGGRAAYLDQLSKEAQDVYANPKRDPYDYEAILKDLYYRRVSSDEAAVALDNDIRRLQVAVEQSQADLAYRKKENGQLTSDLKQFQYEATQSDEYLATLTKQLASTRDDLAQTQGANRQLADKLTAWQLKAADDINRRAAEAEDQAAAPEEIGVGKK